MFQSNLWLPSSEITITSFFSCLFLRNNKSRSFHLCLFWNSTNSQRSRKSSFCRWCWRNQELFLKVERCYMTGGWDLLAGRLQMVFLAQHQVSVKCNWQNLTLFSLLKMKNVQKPSSKAVLFVVFKLFKPLIVKWKQTINNHSDVAGCLLWMFQLMTMDNIFSVAFLLVNKRLSSCI